MGSESSTSSPWGELPIKGLGCVRRPKDQSAVESALRRCSLDSLATRRVDTLSGGELQRVCIARALAQQPRVLLLDEPAAFLDIHHRRDFELLLRETVASERIACLIAMHDLDAARRMGSRVALLHEGRFLASGSSEDVITPELVHRAFGLHGGFQRETVDPENVIDRRSQLIRFQLLRARADRSPSSSSPTTPDWTDRCSRLGTPRPPSKRIDPISTRYASGRVENNRIRDRVLISANTRGDSPDLGHRRSPRGE